MYSAVPTGAVLRLTKTGLDPSSAATVETADSSGERSTDPSGPLSVFKSGAPTWAGRLSRRVALTPGTRPDILLALTVVEC